MFRWHEPPWKSSQSFAIAFWKECGIYALFRIDFRMQTLCCKQWLYQDLSQQKASRFFWILTNSTPSSEILSSSSWYGNFTAKLMTSLRWCSDASDKAWKKNNQFWFLSLKQLCLPEISYTNSLFSCLSSRIHKLKRNSEYGFLSPYI